jgi:D-serine ammonia-lyase
MEQHFDDNKKQHIFATNFTVSVGSTPSLPHHFHPSSDNDNTIHPQQEWWTQFFLRYPTAILEIHPGNYTLYDRQQLYTNACPNVQAIAGRVLTRVIGHYNDTHRPNTLLLDAGATALTKESTPQGGMAAITGHEQTSSVYKMCQEVSMARGNSPQFLQDCPLGTILALQPNHSCLAAACFDKYYIVDDPTGQFAPDTPIVDEWEPVKGW